MTVMTVLLALVLFLIASCEIYTLKTGVPTVTSSPAMRRAMIAILQKEQAARPVGQSFSILDLGSGTGKLALDIGRAIPAAQVRGLEISVTPFAIKKGSCPIKDKTLSSGRNISSSDKLVVPFSDHVIQRQRSSAGPSHQG